MNTRKKTQGDDLPGRLPQDKRQGSYLLDETDRMLREQRQIEQDGHRRFTKVHAREHHEHHAQAAPQEELQQGVPQNPYLESQRFDGANNNLNANPLISRDALTKLENEHREQEKEKQHRLGNELQISSAPRPQGSS